MQALKVINTTSDSSAQPPVVSAFIDLADVPSSYAWQAGKIVRVNAASNGLEFATLANQQYQKATLPITSNWQTIFTIPSWAIIDHIVINAEVYYSNYTVVWTTLTRWNIFNLETTDTLLIIYT